MPTENNKPVINVQLLMTGNEIMSGHTTDTNSSHIAQFLEQLGLTVYRKMTVGDDIELLVHEIQQIAASADLLIINGGLGPTIDDLTAEAVAKACNISISEHPDAVNHLEHWCGKRKIELNEANLKQALLPKGCDTLDNPIGSAVGFSIKHNNCLIMSTPGVPSEMKAMLAGPIKEKLLSHFDNTQSKQTLRLRTFGLGESTLQQKINEQIPDWPEEVELGFRAGLPILEVKLSINDTAHTAKQQQCLTQLNALVGDYIIGQNDDDLAVACSKALAQTQQTLCLAESCTGGLMASQMTRIAGSSKVFEGAFIAYSNSMKNALLNVPMAPIEQHGAVSKAVVEEMATQSLLISGAKLSVAVSGIAGPSGGSEEKPVGTIWLCYGSKEKLFTHHLFIPSERHWVQEIVAAIGLDLIRRHCLGLDKMPRYFNRYLKK